MKKILLLAASATTLVSLVGASQKVSAMVPNSKIQLLNDTGSASAPDKLSHNQIVDNVKKGFDDLKLGDKVLPVEGGGYIHGDVYHLTANSGKLDDRTAKHLNSESDVKSISVAKAIEIEVKKVEDSQNLIALGKSTDPLASDNGTFKVLSAAPVYDGYRLSPGASYHSNAFSGSGWRYAEHLFENTSNRTYQIWQDFVDSGLVGNASDIYNQYQYGSSNGYSLYPYQGKVVVDSGDGTSRLTFYTYNPIAGSSYTVIGQ